MAIYLKDGAGKRVPVAGLAAPVARTATLAAALWQGDGPYSQTVSVAGVRADEAGQLVQVVPASASLGAWEAAGLRCTGQGDGTLSFTAQELPEEAIQLYIILQEVREE